MNTKKVYINGIYFYFIFSADLWTSQLFMTPSGNHPILGIQFCLRMPKIADNFPQYARKPMFSFWHFLSVSFYSFVLEHTYDEIRDFNKRGFCMPLRVRCAEPAPGRGRHTLITRSLEGDGMPALSQKRDDSWRITSFASMTAAFVHKADIFKSYPGM